MPHFRLETNLPKDKVPDDLSQKLCQVIADSLGKPLSYCVATVITDVNMSWGGTKEPAGQATLMSIGAVSAEQNKKHSKVLFELLSKEIGLPSDRLYITYIDASTGNVGYKGTTFKDIFGA